MVDSTGRAVDAGEGGRRHFMDFLLNQLISHASIEPDVDIDNTPAITLYSDPFHEISSEIFNEQNNSNNFTPQILIRKTNLLVNKLLSSTSSPSSIIYVRRVYIYSMICPDYRYIGWVLDCDMDLCMICSDEFSLFNRRHHCRLCGDLVCDDCSKQTIYITEILDYGPVRVCNCCYYGQEEISLKDLVSSFEGATISDIPDNESIFSKSDPTLSTLIGTPYVVMKCKKTNSRGNEGVKVFINICYHTLILGKNTIVIGEDCPKEVVGRNGEYCSVYDVCVSLDSLEQDDIHLEQFFSRVVAVLNRRCRANLDSAYILLRTKKNFKGDHIPIFLLRLADGQIIHEHSSLHLASPLGFADDAARQSPLPLSLTSSTPPNERANSRTRTISSDDHSDMGPQDLNPKAIPEVIIENQEVLSPAIEESVIDQEPSESQDNLIESQMEPEITITSSSEHVTKSERVTPEWDSKSEPQETDEATLPSAMETSTIERHSEGSRDRRLIGGVPLIGLASRHDQSPHLPHDTDTNHLESIKQDKSTDDIVPDCVEVSVPLGAEVANETEPVPPPPPTQASPMSPKIPPPEMYSGWMKRQEGTIISTFVKRYFVLEKCILTCYEMSADTPPYGRNPRGTFQLTPATQIDLISTPSSSPAPSSKRNSIFNKQQRKKSLTQTQILLSDPMRKETMESSRVGVTSTSSDPEEYLLELETIENHARWVQALLHHIEYCTVSSKRRFSMP